MKILAFDPFEEFQQFLADLSFESLLKDKAYVAASKRLHKRVLALLIVEHQFDLELARSEKELTIASASYLHEFRSDLLSSLLVFHLGLYKASMMSARSALENLLRVVAGTQDLDYRNLKSVSDLIELVKTSPLRQKSRTFDSALKSLLVYYGEYCDFVHSTGEEFLSLDRKLGDMPRWQSDIGTKCTDSLVKMLQSAVCVLLFLMPQVLHHLRHDLRDTVLDSLPMKMKSGLADES